MKPSIFQAGQDSPFQPVKTIFIRTILTAVAVIGIFGFTARPDFAGRKQLPGIIASSLQAKYANARIKKWEMQGNEYIVNFIDNKKKCTAYYSSGGRWIRTEISLPWTKDLPQSVKNGLQENGYEAWHVDGIKEVLSAAQPEYVLHVDNGNSLDADHYDAFKRDYLLSFSQNGILEDKKYQN